MTMPAQRFELDRDANLAERLARLAPLSVVRLMQADSLDGPVLGVESVASLTLTDEGEEDFTLSTQFDLSSLRNPAEIADQLLVELPEDIAVNRMPNQIGAFVVYGSRDQGQKADSLVNALNGGRGWGITTSVRHPNFCLEDRILEVEQTLAQHLIVARKLTSIIFENVRSTEDVEVLRLGMPALPEVTHPYRVIDGFESFVGIDAQVQQLRDFIDYANIPPVELAALELGTMQTILLDGPTGSGKKSLMNTLALELGASPREVKFEELTGINGQSIATNLVRIMKEAFDSKSRTLLIFNNADGLLQFGSSAEASLVIATAFQELLDTLKQHPQVFVALATTNPKALNQNLINDVRFPIKVVLEKPSEETRVDIIKHLLVRVGLTVVQLSDDTNIGAELGEDYRKEYDYQSLAQLTEGKTAGEIKAILAQLQRAMFLESRRSGGSASAPTQAQLEAAFKAGSLK